ncbi:hypothetical protein HK102_000148 [Quaeritorhiza haematococci]|nr:hypothetical protein HK102_000148 [Quaeritorhiza haematococci]
MPVSKTCTMSDAGSESDSDTSQTGSEYEDIFRNWSTSALTDAYVVDGFEKLEHQLMKQFFFEALEEITPVLSKGPEVRFAVLQKLVQNAEYIASQLLFRLQNYPLKEQNSIFGR